MFYHATMLNYFRQRDRGWVLSLFAVVLLVYLPFLGNPFVFDDPNVIRPETMEGLVDGGFNYSLRWLSYVSLAWTYFFFSDVTPHFYRLGNLMLHSATVITLFYLLRCWMMAALPDKSKDRQIIWGAWFGALLFALQPVAVYAVGYVVQRSILLATLFVLLMQLYYLKGLLTGKNKWMLLSILAYFLAGLSKEHSLLAPALLAAQTILYRGQIRINLLALVLTWVALGAVGIQIFLLANGVFGSPYEIMAANIFEQQNLMETTPTLYALSIMTQAGLFFKYLWLWLLPNPAWMSIDMREPFVNSVSDWRGWISIVGFAAYGVLGSLMLFRSRRFALLGLAMLYPWLQFWVEFSAIRVQEPFVLYRSYMWMPGVMLFIAWMLVKWPEKKMFIVLSVVALLQLPVAWNRLWVMGDNYRLWNDALLLLSSNSASGADRIFYNRAIAQSPNKKNGEAISDLEHSAKLSPRLAPIHFVLGVEYFNAIRYQDAMAQFDETIRLDPKNGGAYYAKGIIFKRLKDDKQALLQMRKSCELRNKVACVIVELSKTSK